MITIIDYGVGNIGSLVNMFKRLSIDCQITNCPQIISKAKKIILPGVGKFDHGMTNLIKSDLVNILNQKALVEKIPILGICLGAQLMTKFSEEGNSIGLSWFDASVIKFDSNNIRVPHMGWNFINIHKDNLLIKDDNIEKKFYFVHSYYIKANITSDILFTSYYGEEFVSGMSKDNIFALQFHPEKSHQFGMGVLNKFNQI